MTLNITEDQAEYLKEYLAGKLQDNIGLDEQKMLQDLDDNLSESISLLNISLEKELSDFKTKAQNFKTAYIELTTAWNRLSPANNDKINDLTNNYPFDCSFDELEIKEWVDDITNVV